MIKREYHEGRIAIVSHDAGGAEILASYIKQQSLVCTYILEGPAVKVFERHFGSLQTVSLEEGVDFCESVICGTSGQSDLEWRAIVRSREKGKFVVSLLDHWINYPERFVRNGIKNLPDEIWVCDIDAETIATAEFPCTPIKLIDNPYFIDLELELKTLRNQKFFVENDTCIALFVAENITDYSVIKEGGVHSWGYTEFDAIEFFLRNIAFLKENYRTVVIRPHPSDSEGKYDCFLGRYPNLVKISNNSSLLEDIVVSNLVVGCQSMAMVVGLIANKKVMSAIPPGGRICNLPQRDILMLRDII